MGLARGRSGGLRAARAAALAGALACAAGCHATYRFDEAAVAEALSARAAEAKLLGAPGGPASLPVGGAAGAAAVAPGPPRGLAIRSRGGAEVSVPPHGKLAFDTPAGSWVAEPAALALDGAAFAAGGTRVERATVREVTYAKPLHTPLALGAIGSVAVLFGLAALVVWINAH